MDFFELRRRIVRRGTLSTTYADRLVDVTGRTVLEGETARGYLMVPVRFTGPGGTLALTFGGNRRIAPSALILRDGSSALLATVSTGIVQSSYAKVDLPVLDPSGAEMFRLQSVGLPGTEAAQACGTATLNDLAVVAGGRLLAHTVRSSTPAQGAPSSETLLGKAFAVVEVARSLATALATINDPSERVVDVLTITAEGHGFDPRLALAVLLFKKHHVELALTSA